MTIPKERNLVTFDIKEVTDTIYGIKSEEYYSTFIKGRDLHRHAEAQELRTIPGEKQPYVSFGSLKEINL